jgi:hypothetical protein
MLINEPSVVDEVRGNFSRYESALVTDDLATLTEMFLESAEVVRFGINDCERGSEELAQWRQAQPPHRAGRCLSEVTVTTYGDSAAIVTTMFTYPDRPFLGRQSQTWLRLDQGWRIVHAHVSEIPR